MGYPLLRNSVFGHFFWFYHVSPFNFYLFLSFFDFFVVFAKFSTFMGHFFWFYGVSLYNFCLSSRFFCFWTIFGGFSVFSPVLPLLGFLEGVLLAPSALFGLKSS